MHKGLLVLFMCVAVGFGQQTWGSRAQLKGYLEYFKTVTQETVYEIERRGWSTLKLTDINQDLNLQMYKWLVNGTVLYTNGFLISVQNIDITDVDNGAGSSTFQGVTTTRSYVKGRLNFRTAKLGYDVISNITDIGEERYTGDITIESISWELTIQKSNYTTNEITVTSEIFQSSGTVRMVYRPATTVTTVLSSIFRPRQTSDGIETWKDVIETIVLDLVTNKIPYPEICFVDC